MVSDKRNWILSYCYCNWLLYSIWTMGETQRWGTVFHVWIRGQLFSYSTVIVWQRMQKRHERKTIKCHRMNRQGHRIWFYGSPELELLSKCVVSKVSYNCQVGSRKKQLSFLFALFLLTRSSLFIRNRISFGHWQLRKVQIGHLFHEKDVFL